MPRDAFDFPTPLRRVRRKDNWAVTVWISGGVLILMVLACGGLIMMNFVKQRPTPPAVAPSDMPLRTWLAAGEKGQVHFRLTAQLETARDESAWRARLRDYDSGSVVWGRVPKDSDAGRRLFDLLKDGEAHEVGVRLESSDPDKPASQWDDVRIVQFEGGR